METQNRILNQLKDQKELFNHANCLFVIDYKANSAGYFAFYTPSSNYNATNNYLNHIEVIKKFCRYFCHRAKILIKNAEADRLVEPWREQDIGTLLVEERKDVKAVNKGNNICMTLTAREKEIVDLLRESMTAKEAADILCVTQKTIEKHIENIKKKAGCSRRTQLVNFLNQNRL